MLKALGALARGIGKLFQTFAEGAAHLAYAAQMIVYMAVNLVSVAADVIHQLTMLSLQGLRGIGQLMGIVPLDPVMPQQPSAPTPEDVLRGVDAEASEIAAPDMYQVTPDNLAATAKAYASASFRERALMDLGWLDGAQMRWLFGLTDEQLEAVARAPISEVERAISGKGHRIAGVPALIADDVVDVRDDVRDDLDLEEGYAYRPRMGA